MSLTTHYAPTHIPVASSSYVSDEAPELRRTASRHLARAFSRLTSEGGLVFLISFAIYFAISMLLDFKYLAFEGDAVSRLANAFYVLHSRDQHFAAIGFVWNPLSSLLDLPFLLFNSYWNAL